MDDGMDLVARHRIERRSFSSKVIIVPIMTTSTAKRFPTVGACGLDCVLCPRYYTEGRSRCAGCGSNYSSAAIGCKIYRCCVIEKGFGTCAECDSFPCSRLEGADVADSFVSHRKMVANLRSIKGSGMEAFLKEQEDRRALLGRMLTEYNDGRSKSFFCVAAALLPIEALRSAIEDDGKNIAELEDVKGRAMALRSRLNEAAMRESIDLQLRKAGSKK